MTCRRCRRPLSPGRIARGDVFCTRECELLWLLDSDWFLTKSDLALWVFGDDGRFEIDAISTQLYLLRQRGYVLHERRFASRTEDRLTTPRGYRLAPTPARLERAS